MCKPFLIRNWSTGVEYELDSKEKFDAVYGADPSWYIATGEFSAAVQAALAAQGADGAGSDSAESGSSSGAADAAPDSLATPADAGSAADASTDPPVQLAGESEAV